MNIKKYAYEKLLKMGYIYEPKYNLWLSRTYWIPFDAACLLNGVDPRVSHIVEIRYNKENTGIEAKRVRYFDRSNGNTSGADNNDIEIFNCFISDVFDESEVIETWYTFPFPLVLINTYLQKIANIPPGMLKLAKKSFLELYQKRNNDENTSEHWNNYWHNNIAKPFLKLITNEDIKTPNQTKPNQNTIDSTDHNNNSVNEKTILEESTKAREIRIRNRGYEIYKIFKERNPTKKITKEDVAKQIMKEEEPIYKLISAKNLLKKQPALGTYLKELRKTR